MEEISKFIEGCLEPSSTVLTRAIRNRNTLLIKHCLANGVTLSSKDVRIVCAYRPEYFSLIDDDFVFTLEIIQDVIRFSRHENIIKIMLQKCRRMPAHDQLDILQAIVSIDNDIAFRYFADIFDARYRDLTFVITASKIIDILIADKQTAILDTIFINMVEMSMFDKPAFRAIMNYLPDTNIEDIFLQVGLICDTHTMDVFLKHPAITRDVIRRAIHDMAEDPNLILLAVYLEDWLAKH